MVEALNLEVFELSSSELKTSISSKTFSRFTSSSTLLLSLIIFLLFKVKSKFFFEMFETSILDWKFSCKKSVTIGNAKKDRIIIVLAKENFERLFRSFFWKTFLLLLLLFNFLILAESGFINIESFLIFLGILYFYNE